MGRAPKPFLGTISSDLPNLTVVIFLFFLDLIDTIDMIDLIDTIDFSSFHFSLFLGFVAAAAVFVFLAAATGAGVVAAHFLLDMHGLGLGTLAGLLAGGLVHGALGVGGGAVVAGLEAFLLGAGLASLFHLVLLAHGQAGADEEGGNLAVDFEQHLLEEVEALEFVDEQGVFLLVGGVLDAGFEFVELAQMVFPEVVDDGEGDALLDAELHLAALVFVRLLDGGDDVEGLLAVGDGEGDVDVAGVLVDALDEGVGELGDALHAFLVGGIDEVEEFLDGVVVAGVEELAFGEGDVESEDADHLEFEALPVVVFEGVVVDEGAGVVEHGCRRTCC